MVLVTKVVYLVHNVLQQLVVVHQEQNDGGQHHEGFGFPHVPFNRGDVGAGLELRSDLEEFVEEDGLDAGADFVQVFGDRGDVGADGK